MRRALLTVAGAGFLMLVGTAPSFASDVNCGIVMKSVKMGRSAQDIADTMMISTSDVEKCKADAAKAGDQPAAGGAKPPGTAEKAPDAGMKPGASAH
jgi:hypothetical protein